MRIKIFIILIFLLILFIFNSNLLFGQIESEHVLDSNIIINNDYSTDTLNQENISQLPVGSNVRGFICAEDMDSTDKEMLNFAKEAAKECSEVLYNAIKNKIKTREEIFSTLYFPIIPVKHPPTFTTFYDDYTDKYITPVIDKYLEKKKNLSYVVIVDKNGYVPSHNSKYCQKFTGNVSVDLKQNRTKRIFNDSTGFWAAKNLKEYLIQIYHRDTGESMADLSVPIFIENVHWGALRIGYTRGE